MARQLEIMPPKFDFMPRGPQKGPVHRHSAASPFLSHSRHSSLLNYNRLFRQFPPFDSLRIHAIAERDTVWRMESKGRLLALRIYGVTSVFQSRANDFF